jgi:glycosyltransferase involved in cell wall biosynthesis
MAERLVAEGDVRAGAIGADLGPADARALLGAWLAAVDLDLPAPELLAHLQDDGFSHADLYRRARRCHERRLRAAVGAARAGGTAGGGVAALGGALLGVFEATVAAIPYAPATAFLARETRRLAPADGSRPRVALVADGIAGMHGVSHTVQQVRERGVPGFEVDVLGTDAEVDRRLASVADVEIPTYEGLRVGVPSVPAVVEALAAGRYDAVHLCAPGPAGITAALCARMLGLPVAGSYHTELSAYAGLRTGDAGVAMAVDAAVATFYGQCSVVLSPSAAADRRLAELGIPDARVQRWGRGVDAARFDPGKRDPRRFGAREGRVIALYAGRLAREKGVDLLAEAVLAARARDPRLYLVVAGCGPEEAALRARLGGSATFLGRLEDEELATAYASADLFAFCSRTDTFGQVVQEAQASGLPVVAVAAGGPAELVSDGRTGLLCPPRAGAVADALCALAARPDLRRRLGAAGRAAVRDRTWEASLAQLGAGWARATGTAEAVVSAPPAWATGPAPELAVAA